MWYQTLPNAASARETGKSGKLYRSHRACKNRSVLHKVHIQLFRLCLLDAFEPQVRTVLNPVSSQSQQWIWRQHLWAIFSQNKDTLSNWAQLQTWFLICHTRSQYGSTSVGLSSSNCSLPEYHISLKKDAATGNVQTQQQLLCPQQESRHQQTQSHADTELRDVSSYFILHECNPHNQK